MAFIPATTAALLNGGAGGKSVPEKTVQRSDRRNVHLSAERSRARANAVRPDVGNARRSRGPRQTHDLHADDATVVDAVRRRRSRAENRDWQALSGSSQRLRLHRRDGRELARPRPRVPPDYPVSSPKGQGHRHSDHARHHLHLRLLPASQTRATIVHPISAPSNTRRHPVRRTYRRTGERSRSTAA